MVFGKKSEKKTDPLGKSQKTNTERTTGGSLPSVFSRVSLAVSLSQKSLSASLFSVVGVSISSISPNV